MTAVVLQTFIPGIPCRRGKVRDVYDFGDRLLIVATDRISAFDHILPNGIPNKGAVLTAMSGFWFERLNVRHHLISTCLQDVPLPEGCDRESLRGRSMVVRKTNVIPVECVVRGFLAGSGWKEYRKSGSVCGLTLPPGLQESSRLPETIFTPATKAESGHDENISFAKMCTDIGTDLAVRLRDLSLSIYEQGVRFAETRGILIADTKFEFGICDDDILLIDEVMTPDSSRFWPADQYAAGRSQSSFDKQFVRDWLESSGWDKESDPPELPETVVTRTSERYIEAFERLTGQPFHALTGETPGAA